MHKIHGTTDYWQKKKHEEQLMEELMVGVCCWVIVQDVLCYEG